MIFNEYTGTSSYDNMVVTESPYPLGLEGALMHVWENECNYNAMMKAVGISELRYYQETGGDLFVQEAGAFGGFIAKAKAFFKKVIEKIKQIFHKFAAIINQYSMDDKKFVKTYQKEIMRRDYTDFEVEGYTFAGLGAYAGNMKGNYEAIIEKVYSNATEYLGVGALGKDDDDDTYKNAIDSHTKKVDGKIRSTYAKDSNELEDAKDKLRADFYKELSGESTSSMDTSEFSEEVKNYLYGNDGDKDTLEIGLPELRKYLEGINSAEKDINYANKIEKKATSEIGKFIKRLEKIEKDYIKFDKADNDEQNAKKTAGVTTINNVISLVQASSNDTTVFCGILVQALKDRNRQAKAICVKALSYKNKNESATYTESYYDNDDIFANVVIR